jgi:hypothetical protein
MRRYYCVIIIFCLVCFGATQVWAAGPEGKAPAKATTNNGKDKPSKPLLSVTPKEIDLGSLAPGAEETAVYTLKNLGTGVVNWTLIKPEGWYCQDEQKISGKLEGSSGTLKIKIKHMKGNGDAKSKGVNGTILISLETENKTMNCKKELTPGSFREIVKIASNAGTRSLFIKFKINPTDKEPVMEVNPSRMDFGTVHMGEQITKRLSLTNKGRDMLKWSVDPNPIIPPERGTVLKKGRYISFLNESVKSFKTYTPSSAMKETLEIFGLWTEDAGYPVSGAPNSTIKLKYYGKGIAVLFWRNPDGGSFSAYIDDKFISRFECLSEHREDVEMLIAEGLADGPHTLSLISKEGHNAIEGVRVFSREVMKGGGKWIKALPISGRTSRETDFINITIDAQHLNPGWYGDYIAFNSNGGKKLVEVSLEVMMSNVQKLLDVYRYARGYDFFLTTNPQAESRSLQAGNYQKQGIAFRLFGSGTPGTTGFHRWYNPQKGDRFYSSDPKGGRRSLNGYFYEGIIGNIATSRLTNSRELYRWYNPSTGNHFFTTDPRGDGMTKKGYRFDGIAGYVR